MCSFVFVSQDMCVNVVCESLCMCVVCVYGILSICVVCLVLRYVSVACVFYVSLMSRAHRGVKNGMV